MRQKAQFELADRGSVDPFLAVVRQRENQLARVHAIWGIGQLARKDARHLRSIVPLLSDADPEIRAQAAKLLGDLRYAAAARALTPLLMDAEARPRFFAAEALGRIGHEPAVQPIVAMLRANNDADVMLRQAGATALARIGESAPLVALSSDQSRAVRSAAVVALRHLRDPGVATFLRDADEYIVAEAARAINDDESIEAALPQLAATLEDTRFRGEPLIRRAINANLRVGTAEAAGRVAAFAVRPGANDTLRAEALATLGVWPKPSVLDRVDGFPRGQVVRDSAIARAALAAIVEPLFSSGSATVQVALADAVGRLRLREAAPTLFAKVSSGEPQVRIAALRALAAMGDNRSEQAVRTALADADPTVRTAALALMSSLALPEATQSEMLASLIERGTVGEQQAALAELGRQQGATGREVLTRLVDRLERGSIAPEIQLDVIEAARAANSEPLNARLRGFDQARANAAATVAYAEALRGGEARAGQRVVNQHPGAQCTRCHTLGGGVGGNVGPALNGIGARLTREQLLESLVAPSARIAPGFGTVTVTLRNGQTVAGALTEEDDASVTVQAAGATPRRIAKSDVANRVNGISAMPPMGGILNRREIRDVVEYLSSLR
ncbi:MAG: HEAT repeat domain-containing protein [Gemmatimonadetes bacterium]|nr:HEAT repeat domain-containing protein [Gemmatimonadota bacterium]